MSKGDISPCFSFMSFFFPTSHRPSRQRTIERVHSDSGSTALPPAAVGNLARFYLLESPLRERKRRREKTERAGSFRDACAKCIFVAAVLQITSSSDLLGGYNFSFRLSVYIFGGLWMVSVRALARF